MNGKKVSKLPSVVNKIYSSSFYFFVTMYKLDKFNPTGLTCVAQDSGDLCKYWECKRQCILESRMCDGAIDCWDNSDETFCGKFECGS